MKKIFKTDWLASTPVFYNEKSHKISHNINDVIDWYSIEFHPEGLNNYLDFGYSVFGQTPVKNVKFLKHSSEIFLHNNELKIINHPDPVLDWFSSHPSCSREKDVLELIEHRIQQWEAATSGPILIPTSGGFDSRLLNYFIKDRSRIRAFTYGVSPRQVDSYEVVYAKALCDKLCVQWKRIELGDQHKYFNEWFRLFGVATHAHGMYHCEFYNKILHCFPELKGCNLLSGIIGDGWAGGIEHKVIKESNFSDLGYTHGLNADSSFSKFNSSRQLMKSFFFQNNVNHELLQVVYVLRTKMMLLNFLLTVPQYYGFNVWSPFLDMDIALNMLNISPERRKGRIWQVDFFRNNGLYLEERHNKSNTLNNLNHQALSKRSVKPLDTKSLSRFISTKYAKDINRKLTKPSYLENIIPFLFSLPIPSRIKKKIIKGFKRIGFRDYVLESYYAYLTLKPIESLMKKGR